MKILALIGIPGSGKSTMMRAIMGPWGTSTQRSHGLLRYHRFASPSVHVLGVYGDSIFPGTDRLSMSVQPDAMAFVRNQADEISAPAIAFEGDRLATPSFLDCCAAAGELKVAIVDVSPDLVHEWVKGRNSVAGQAQSQTWRRGRTTKVKNLTKYAKDHGVLDLVSVSNHATQQAAILRLREWIVY